MGRRKLPPRELAEVLGHFPDLRQSLLGDFDSCRLMARFGLETTPFNNQAQARGIIFHRFAGEVLKTLRRQGEDRIPVEEALTILYEVCAQRDVPPEEVVTVNAEQRRLLRIAVIKFASENRFRMDRLIDVERRLWATVRYPQSAECSTCVRHPRGDRRYGVVSTGRLEDGRACRECGGSGLALTGGMVERRLTGQPDALVADPPDGAVVLDWKTTLKPPPVYKPRREDGHHDHDRGLSYLGYFQQRMYALLVMTNYPAVSRVTMREFYPLAGEARVATVLRTDLEHIERELAGIAEQLDRALMAGGDSPLWHPSPGRHCTFCPRPMSCPIDAEVRMSEGGITSAAQASRAAAQFVLVRRDDDVLREALKAWVEEYGPVPVRSGKGRYEVRWKAPKEGNGRGTFGVHVPEVSDRGPADPSMDENIAAAFEAAAERREAAKA